MKDVIIEIIEKCEIILKIINIEIYEISENETVILYNDLEGFKIGIHIEGENINFEGEFITLEKFKNIITGGDVEILN